MWNNNCTTHQMSAQNEGSSFSSPRFRVSPNRNNNNLQFLQPLSPGYSNYYVEVSSPVYAFPYPMGSSWPLYQSPRGIGKIFGLVPATPRPPLTAAVLSPAVGRGLNVSWMSTTRGINVAEDLSSLKMDRFKVRIVELGDHDDGGHKS